MTRRVCGTPSPNSRAGTHTPAGHSHTVLCEENHRGFLIINTQLTHNSQAFLPPASLAYTAHKFFSQRPQVQRWQPPSLSKHKAPPGERQSHSSKVLYKKTNTPENVTTPSPAVKLLKMLWNALQRRQIRGLDDSRVTRAFHCTVPRLPQKHLHTAAFWEPKPLQSMACYVTCSGRLRLPALLDPPVLPHDLIHIFCLSWSAALPRLTSQSAWSSGKFSK